MILTIKTTKAPFTFFSKKPFIFIFRKQQQITLPKNPIKGDIDDFFGASLGQQPAPQNQEVCQASPDSQNFKSNSNQGIEEERMKIMYQKEQAERAEKVKRIEKDKTDLNQWKT